MPAELPELRSRLGESAALWARQVQVEDGRWRAFSDAFSPRYNLVLCHGAGLLAGTLDEVAAAGRPAIVMVAGAARGEVPDDGDWVPVAEMPFMARELTGDLAEDPAVRRLEAAELPAARTLIAEVFGLHERLALTALPPDAAERHHVWGAFAGELASCAITVAVGDCLAVWSMATAPALRRQGHARRVLSTALARAGARTSLLYAPIEAEPFYRSLGYEVLERWQLWTRRRWRGA